MSTPNVNVPAPAPAPSVEEDYRVWSVDMPFRKDGAPVVGTFGREIRRVLIIEAETFRRMVNEHPTLAACRFDVGEFVP